MMICFPGFDMELPHGRIQSGWDIELLMLKNVAKHMKGFNGKTLNSLIWNTVDTIKRDNILYKKLIKGL